MLKGPIGPWDLREIGHIQGQRSRKFGRQASVASLEEDREMECVPNLLNQACCEHRMIGILMSRLSTKSNTLCHKTNPERCQNDAKTKPKRRHNDPKTIPKRDKNNTKIIRNDPKTIPPRINNTSKTIQKRYKKDPQTNDTNPKRLKKRSHDDIYFRSFSGIFATSKSSNHLVNLSTPRTILGSTYYLDSHNLVKSIGNMTQFLI